MAPKQKPATLSSIRRSMRRQLLGGFAVIALLGGGIRGGSTASLAGALIAPGQIVVDSNVKKVQHPTGGIVGEIRVKDGSHVKQGDLLNRGAVYRVLKAEGLGRLPGSSRSRKSDGIFRDYDLGFVHLDVKHLPKLRTADGQSRKRYPYVAIDRPLLACLQLAVKDDEAGQCAGIVLKKGGPGPSFKITHELTDRGSCFTADRPASRRIGSKPLATHGCGASPDPALHVAHERHGRALQRKNSARAARHHRLKTPRSGNPAARLPYNGRLQRLLKMAIPDMIVRVSDWARRPPAPTTVRISTIRSAQGPSR